MRKLGTSGLNSNFPYSFVVESWHHSSIPMPRPERPTSMTAEVRRKLLVYLASHTFTMQPFSQPDRSVLSKIFTIEQPTPASHMEVQS